jgi:acyl-CoA dehydrogenase
MDFNIPQDLQDYLKVLDQFILDEIKPLEQQNDNIRFFDHRREDARTDWERGGLPNEEWEALLGEARRRADKAGHYRYPLAKEYGGQDGTNLGMAVIREHFAAMGLGLHNDLQNEHSIVGNSVGLLLMLNYGTPAQQAEWVPLMLEGKRGFAFGITEPNHGSDATHMETNAVRDGDGWRINGEKTWNTGIHKAQYDMIMARTSGKPGDGDGITAFLVPMQAEGMKVEEMLWTMVEFPLLMSAWMTLPFLAVKAEACRWSSTSSTKTAFARRHQAWVLLSIVLTSLLNMRCSASHLASPCHPTRVSSFPSWNCRPSVKCSVR